MPSNHEEKDHNNSSNINDNSAVTTTRSNSPSISSSHFPLTLEFIDVTYRIKLAPTQTTKNSKIMQIFNSTTATAISEERTILNGITGKAYPGELLAILGPSGSGKSTLLNLITGRLHGKHSGTILTNGHRITKSMLRRTGFVTQDDVLYPHLTVRETLVFCALLRLPRTVKKADKVDAAEAVMVELGLCKCGDSIVGNSIVRGISGGERRRVSIGHEMLMNPSLLVLDEPTSGLDSTSAARLVGTLAGMARKGKTLVMSVHQPSSRVYQMFDSVLLLSEGNCMYFGKAVEAMDYFGDVGFRPRFHVNPADFMLDLANGITPSDYHGDADKSTVKQSIITSYSKVLEPKVKASITTTISKDVEQIGGEGSIINRMDHKDYSSIGFFSQFAILLQRSIKERRHEAFNSLRVFQVIAAAFLAGSMWWHSSINDVHDRLGLLFFISIFWGVFASCNAVFTFPQERAIFIKERASGMYTLSSYFMARIAGELPMELILPTVFTFILYWMAGLRPDPSAFILTLSVLLGYVLVAQGLGLAIGAAIMDAKQASTIATVTMLAFLLTGGFYVHNVPSCLTWLKYTSFTYYCYRLLIGVQYSEDEIASTDFVRRHKAESGLNDEVTPLVSVIVLIAMFFGYRVLAYIALRRIRV